MYKLLPKENEIIAILPDYGDAGQQTLIYLTSGDIISYQRKPATVIRYLAVRRSLDLYCLRAKAAKLTKSILFQPLPISPSLLLVPMKYRRPRIARDGTIGYFNFYEIEDILPRGNRSLLVFKNGTNIPVLWKKPAIDLHLQRAHLAGLACKQELYNANAAEIFFKTCLQASELLRTSCL